MFTPAFGAALCAGFPVIQPDGITFETLAAARRRRSATLSGISFLLIKASAPAERAACCRASRWLISTTTRAAGHAFRSSSRATLGDSGNRSQSTNSMSIRLSGALANVADQSAASPTTSIFKSSSSKRRADRSSDLASATNTRVMYSCYRDYSPAASYGWGVLVSAIWGRKVSGSQFMS